MNEDAVQVIIKVVRKEGDVGVVSVDYETIDDSAVAGEDYRATSGTLVFSSGELEQDIAISILDDSKQEPDESFIVKLTNITAGASLLDDTTKVYIKGNDNADNSPEGSDSPNSPGNSDQPAPGSDTDDKNESRKGDSTGGGSVGMLFLLMLMLVHLYHYKSKRGEVQ